MSTVVLSPAAAELASPPQAAARRSEILPSYQRYGVAGIGAVLPLLLGSNHVWEGRTEPAVVISFLLSSAVFLVAGLAVAWLYPDEHNRLKLLQLGVAAPAMFTALVTGPAPKPARTEPLAVQAPPAAVQASLRLVLATPAHAASVQPRVYSFHEPPREGLGVQIWRGITRSGPRYGDVFVYLPETFATAGAAFARAAEIERSTGLATRVYGPGGPSRGYVVVLGDWLVPDDAVSVVAEVRRKGVRADLYTRPS